MKRVITFVLCFTIVLTNLFVFADNTLQYAGDVIRTRELIEPFKGGVANYSGSNPSSYSTVNGLGYIAFKTPSQVTSEKGEINENEGYIAWKNIAVGDSRLTLNYYFKKASNRTYETLFQAKNPSNQDFYVNYTEFYCGDSVSWHGVYQMGTDQKIEGLSAKTMNIRSVYPTWGYFYDADLQSKVGVPANTNTVTTYAYPEIEPRLTSGTVTGDWYTKMPYFQYSTGTDATNPSPHVSGASVYYYGMGFRETATYHSLTMDIGDGTYNGTVKTLNFGTDAVDGKKKVIEVEDYADVSLRITAPFGHKIETVKLINSSGTTDYSSELAGKSNCTLTLDDVRLSGIIQVTYDEGADTDLSPEEEVARINAINPDFEGHYKTVDGVRLPIKIYYPEKENTSKTAFLIIHGGAWYAIKQDSDTWNGSNMQFQAKYYADRGYTVAAISYRDIGLTENTTAYDLIEDCKDAVKYMRDNLDFDKLVIVGESSGGHLAVELGLDDEVGADIVIGANPVLDVVNKWTYVAKTDADRRALSPAFNTKKTDTKFLIMHGSADADVSPAVSEKFCTDMANVGTACEYISLDGKKHSFIIQGYISTDKEVLDYMGMIDDYLARNDVALYYDTYKSNTTAALGNQHVFESDGKEHTGRIFYKISTGGTYDYSFTFSGTIDSTYFNGSASYADMVCDDYTITSLKVAAVDGYAMEAFKSKNPRPNTVNMSTDGDMTNTILTSDFYPVTFNNGSASVDIKNGATVYTDPIELTFAEDDYICLEISYKGTKLPCISDINIRPYVLTDGVWTYSNKVPVPGIIGCDKKVSKSIVFIGDSITQGIGTTADTYTHWVARLEEILGDDYSFWNIGLGCARAGDAAKDGVWLNKAKYADVVVVCLGVNDVYHVGTQSDIYHFGSQTGAKICEFYEDILEALSDKDRQILWQTMPPFDYNLTSTTAHWKTANDYIRNTIINKVDCVFDTVPHLQASATSPHSTQYGQHPNALGCNIWAEALAPVLEQLLKSNYSVKNLSVNGNSVSCHVSGYDKQSTPVLYAAIYDGDKFIEARVVNNPSGDTTLTFANMSQASSCKLILADLSSFMPLYNKRVFSISK